MTGQIHCVIVLHTARTGKEITDLRAIGGGARHTFYTQGGQIVAERREMGNTTHTLEFFYDEAGRPLQVFFCNGQGYQRVFNYVLNLQGDVIEVRNSTTGAVYARYLYNAWGELLESSGWFAEHNPLRYRGYFWCSAVGLYYLQSRYYCPGIGRFINADALVSTGQGFLGFNMFAYCLNNPVNFVDPDGYAAQSAFQRLVMRIRIRVNTRRVNANNARLGRAPRAMNPTAGQMSGAISHNVPSLDQGLRQLCWAYAQAMVESWQVGEMWTQNEGSLRAQTIAMGRHGADDWNQPGWPTNRGSRLWGHRNLSALFRALQDGPVYAHYGGRLWHDASHLVVVTGVCLITERVRTQNPWGAEFSGWQTHQEFLAGFIGGKEFGFNAPLVNIYRVN